MFLILQPSSKTKKYTFSPDVKTTKKQGSEGVLPALEFRLVTMGSISTPFLPLYCILIQMPT